MRSLSYTRKTAGAEFAVSIDFGRELDAAGQARAVHLAEYLTSGVPDEDRLRAILAPEPEAPAESPAPRKPSK